MNVCKAKTYCENEGIKLSRLAYSGITTWNDWAEWARKHQNMLKVSSCLRVDSTKGASKHPSPDSKCQCRSFGMLQRNGRSKDVIKSAVDWQWLNSITFKDAPGTSHERFDRGGGEMEPGTTTASLWWRSTCSDGKMKDDMVIKTKNRTAHTTGREEFQDSRIHLLTHWKNVRQLGRKNVKREQRLAERSEDLQKQKFTVEKAGEWWNTSTAFSVSGVNAGPGAERSWTESWAARQRLWNVVFSFKRKEEERHSRDLACGPRGKQERFGKKTNSPSCLKWLPKTSGEPRSGHAIQSQMWYCRRWNEQQKKTFQNAVDVRDFATFPMKSVKRSIAHKPPCGEIPKPNKERNRHKMETTWSINCLTHIGHCCTIVWSHMLPKSRSMGTTRWVKVQDEIGNSQKILQSWWKRKVAFAVGLIDDFRKYLFPRVQSGGRPSGEPGDWRAGDWSGCRVIQGVDRDKWITRCKIAVPLKTSTVMAAEIAGPSMLTGTLDLVTWQTN